MLWQKRPRTQIVQLLIKPKYFNGNMTRPFKIHLRSLLTKILFFNVTQYLTLWTIESSSQFCVSFGWFCWIFCKTSFTIGFLFGSNMNINTGIEKDTRIHMNTFWWMIVSTEHEQWRPNREKKYEEKKKPKHFCFLFSMMYLEILFSISKILVSARSA